MRVAQGWTEAAEPAGRFEKLLPGSKPTAKASVIPTAAALQIQPKKRKKQKNKTGVQEIKQASSPTSKNLCQMLKIFCII